ncbi:glycosyltransferase [Chitinibacter tainanensis]|uniref:glycosyltransferase n=1 Tax=Chitinibacter tainanensis TaxID=230667 RepID=UPI0003FA7A55|nr:glycosyl transferase [Chitinibacter tainanensis]
MKVSGFTFLRNGSMLGYPYVESLRSLLLVCDEIVVAVGRSEDDTLEQVRAINDPRIRIVETVWNEGMAQRGYVYAQQKMIAQFNCTGDWAFYLEGDEVIHEEDAPKIRAVLEQHLHNPQVEAIAFDYHHFYGSPDLVAKSPAWYRQAPRIIRNTIRSWAPDGLFWVVMDKNKKGRYPRAALAGCPIYHYGHVRSAEKMQEKNRQVAKYWSHAPKAHDYSQIDASILQPFAGTHPLSVQQWLREYAETAFSPDPSYRLSKRERRHRWMIQLEKLLNRDLTKKHFTIV